MLAQCLLDLSFSEQRVEAMRETLSLVPDFSPLAAFGEVDVYRVGSVEAADLVGFWERLGVQGSEWEARMVIQQYDSNADGRLAEWDFLQVTLPATNPGVRSLALDRRDGSFTREVSLYLTRLTELELSYHRSLRASVLELRSQGDFSVSAAFASASLPRSTHVTRISLRALLDRNRVEWDERTIDAILRRLDTDGDDRLSYTDFSSLFIDLPSLSPLERSSLSLHLPTKSPPSRAVDRPSEATAKPMDEESDVRLSSKSLRSYTRSQSRGGSRSSAGLEEAIGVRFETGGRVGETQKEALLGMFEERLKFLREAEGRRRELMMDCDFNLEDAYHLFDPSDKGYLTPSSLESGLLSLGVNLHPSDPRLLMSEYSPSPSRLSFTDFCAMLFPFSILRYPSNSPPTPPTKQRIKDILQLLIDTERRIEAYRQTIAKLGATAGELFSSLDRDRDGNLTVGEVRYFLEKNGVRAGEREVVALVATLDRNKDGRVTEKEFGQALAPKGGDG